MGERRALRIRAFVAAWFGVLVVTAVVLAGVGAWGTYTTHVDPAETTEQRAESVGRVTTAVTHSATVSRPNPVFPVGSELQNRSTYFLTISPVAETRTTVSQRGLQNASVGIQARLLLRSVESGSPDDQTVYWTDTRPLNTTSVASVEAGESASLAISLNVSAVRARIGEIRSTLGAPGEATATVVIETQVDGTADGEPVSREIVRRIQIGLDGDTYSVRPDDGGVEQIRRTTTVAVAREYGPVRSVGGPAALVVGLAGLVALAVGRLTETFELSPGERQRLAFLDDRAQFDEWIVSVHLPDDDRPVAEAGSLADLVDLAIDTEAGVVEDPTDQTFTVVGEEFRYRYVPPEPVDVDTVTLDGLFPALGGAPVGDGGTSADHADSTNKSESAGESDLSRESESAVSPGRDEPPAAGRDIIVAGDDSPADSSDGSAAESVETDDTEDTADAEEESDADEPTETADDAGHTSTGPATDSDTDTTDDDSENADQ